MNELKVSDLTDSARLIISHLNRPYNFSTKEMVIIVAGKVFGSRDKEDLKKGIEQLVECGLIEKVSSSGSMKSYVVPKHMYLILMSLKSQIDRKPA